MERPRATTEPKLRQITAEIVYLDAMRREGVSPEPFMELGDMAIQAYEIVADQHLANGTRPGIMDEYDAHDKKTEPMSQAEKDAFALADELLKLRESEADRRWSFLDIAVDASPQDVYDRLTATTIGAALLARPDEQLAIPSDGEYRPKLDITRDSLELSGVGVRVWGWDDKKIVPSGYGQPFSPQSILVYPSGEPASARQIDVTFDYDGLEDQTASETVSLYIGRSYTSAVRSVWMPAYAETGYEGHARKQLEAISDETIDAFCDIAADIVGDHPETLQTRNKRICMAALGKIELPDHPDVVSRMLDVSWPSQVYYDIAVRRYEVLGDLTVVAALSSDDQNMRQQAERIVDEFVSDRSGVNSDPEDFDPAFQS